MICSRVSVFSSARMPWAADRTVAMSSFSLDRFPKSSLQARPTRRPAFAHPDGPVCPSSTRHRRKEIRHGGQAGRQEDRDPRHRRRRAGRADRAAQGARGGGRADRPREPRAMARSRPSTTSTTPTSCRSTRSSSDVSADDYDGLLIPGGVANGDFLRADEDAVRFTADFAKAHKPIAAICHAPWVLVEAGIVKGRTITSFPSLADRRPQRGRHLGRRGGPRRPRPRHQPQARRHPGLQREGDRGVLRGRARGHAAAGGRGDRVAEADAASAAIPPAPGGHPGRMGDTEVPWHARSGPAPSASGW